MSDHPKDMPTNDPLANTTKDSAAPENKDGNTNVPATETANLETANPLKPQEEIDAKPDGTAANSNNLSASNLELGELALGDLEIGELEIGELAIGNLNIGDLTGDESAINELETNDLVPILNVPSASNAASEQALPASLATDADLSANSDLDSPVIVIHSTDSLIDNAPVPNVTSVDAPANENLTKNLAENSSDATELNKTEDSPAPIQLTKEPEVTATSATIITASSLLTAAKGTIKEDAIDEHFIKDNAIQADSAKDSQGIADTVSAVPIVDAAEVNQTAHNADAEPFAPVAPITVDGSIDAYDNDNANANQGFFSAFLQTLAAVFKDKGVLLMIIVAPIIYGFFYPWPYSAEVVNQVPVGVVDYDHSSLSNTLAQYAAASPQLETHPFLNEQAAIEAIWRDEIAGYMIIPSGLEKKVKSSQAASVTVIGNGGYLLLNKNVQIGFLKAVSTVSAGIEIKKSVAQGAYSATAQANTQAVPLHITPLYNQSEGYGAYVVPGVSILILQQTLMMGTALLISTLYEQRRHYTSARGWLGRIFALSFLGFIMGCFYYGWVFDIHDYARGENLIGSLVFLAVYFPAVAALGCLLGLWFRERERGLQILIVSSLPIFFVSDYPWPADQLPTVLQYLRWFIPSSAGINTSVQLNQMGASLTQVMPKLFILVALFVFYYTALLLLESSRKRRALP
ncbi:ABC transporter permease [Psychrobacter arenosus]|uniref:ABC transporter permease n=1 Tax=Psychrobacter arenosus TaxID=256326 RepID=UPI002233E880|nr:ABC transporter permease [Psychrobacter arenosus]